MVNDFAPTAVQHLDATAPRKGGDLLGLWAISPPESRDVAFGAQGIPERTIPLWRIALPPDLGLAAARLSEAEAILAGTQRALEGSLGRLQAFIPTLGSGVAFSSPAELARAGQPEAMLAELLHGALPDERIVFGLGEQRTAGWHEITRQFRRFADQLATAVGSYARVDTYLEGRRLGWTIVGWSGDLNTCWPAGGSMAEADMHLRAVGLALTSRAALIRMAGPVARGAGLLAVATASPLGPFLALPAAWRFIGDVVAEHRAGECCGRIATR